MRKSNGNASIDVGTPTLSRLPDGRNRVAAKVDGAEIHVTADEELAANGDAWASALLLPAAKAGATLRIDADLDQRLRDNLDRIQAIARSYWCYPGATVAPRGIVSRKPGVGRAMFFSGGADSFYTLHQRRGELDRLISVHGFDVPLADRARFATVRSWLGEVAAELGIRPVFPETNLREHPAFRAAPWEATHGAALATIAHALAPHVARALIATSDNPAPWGSRPGLDPLWSSNAVEIVSDGGVRKIDKIEAIAHWPLVHRYLRVCWLNTSSAMNCGACSKCVRTQILFHLYGAREKLQTFPQRPLVELIDELPARPADKDFSIWTELIERVREPALIDAIGRFVRRKPTLVQRVAKRTVWMRRGAAGRWLRQTGKRLLARR